MKKHKQPVDMRREYRLDYREALWGQYAGRYAEGTRSEAIDSTTLLPRRLPRARVVRLARQAPRFPLVDREGHAGSHYAKKVA